MIAICAIFKNEYPYILEWIAYHRCLGINHFYIADNISIDGSTELLKALHELGVIRRTPYPTEPGIPPQIGAYNSLFNSAEEEWLAFIDADEFITPSNYEEGLNELHILLGDTNASAIALNWAVYGSSCSIIPENTLVTERLTKRAGKDHPVNRHYKSIVRKRDTLCAGKTPHDFILHDGKFYIKTTGAIEADSHGLSKTVDWIIARINHYVIKSRAEFITKKSARGRATTIDSNLNRTLSFFRNHDLNQIEDVIPRWFIQKIKAEKKLIIEQLDSFGYSYTDVKYPTSLYRTAHGMGKGCIDFLAINNGAIEMRGWAIDRNNYPIKDVIAVVNSEIILKCTKLIFRDRIDLSESGLGSGIGAGFNVSMTRPGMDIKSIDFYGLDINGLAVVELKGSVDPMTIMNAS
ncbi:glycosyltransferase family 2 protein [Aeromonas veronii]|uniref:glycosyltransferase family 2 protein n=1 Tax=Aeromonas veronii TaxID=654 RepID=UPI00301C1D28